MFCENCGSKLLEGAKFCGSCGAKTEPAQPAYSTAAATAPARPVPPPPPTQTYSAPTQTVYTQQAKTAYVPPHPPVHPALPGVEPLRVGQYIGMLLLMGIPLLNIILMFVWSFGGSVNLNKKNFARAILIFAAIGVIISILFGAALFSAIGDLIGGMISYY